MSAIYRAKISLDLSILASPHTTARSSNLTHMSIEIIFSIRWCDVKQHHQQKPILSLWFCLLLVQYKLSFFLARDVICIHGILMLSRALAPEGLANAKFSNAHNHMMIDE